MSDRRYKQLANPGSWTYRWADGWKATVTLSQVGFGERAKSTGFRGYSWMVDSILAVGAINAINTKAR